MRQVPKSTRLTPPRDTRFKAGRSGNPNGRPKGAVNFKTLIERELRKSIVITENSRQKRLTKQEIIVRRLAHEGIKGDYKAIELLMKLANSAGSKDAEVPEEEFAMPDKAALKTIARRLKNIIEEEGHG